MAEVLGMGHNLACERDICYIFFDNRYISITFATLQWFN